MNARATLKDIPARTPESEAMSETLKKRGFKFVGRAGHLGARRALGPDAGDGGRRQLHVHLPEREPLDGRLLLGVRRGRLRDLPRVIRYLCADDSAPKTLAPPHDYGVVLMLHESVHLVVPAEQRTALHQAIVTFLDASSAESSDRVLSARLFADARASEATLPEPARSLMHAVNERDVRTLGRLLAPFAEQIGGAPALSPVRSPATRVPVFLLHGADDNVIPPTESEELQRYLTGAGNDDVELLLTPLLTHADARADVGMADVWRLVRFWTRMWKTFTAG